MATPATAALAPPSRAAMLRTFAPYRLSGSAEAIAVTEARKAARHDVDGDAAMMVAADQQEHKYDGDGDGALVGVVESLALAGGVGDPDRILTDDQATFLIEHHVRSLEDVLCVHSCHWPIAGVFPRALLERLQLCIRAGFGVTAVSGMTLARRQAQTRGGGVSSQISSRVPSLDALLGGGLWAGEVTEVVAASCAGKTQLCVQLATVAAMSGQRVVVLDTSNTFDMARGQQMAKEMEAPQGKVLSGGDWAPLAQIRIGNAYTAFTLLETLESLRRDLESRLMAPPQLLIIDSLGGVVAPVIGAAKGRGHEIMMLLVRSVKALAFDYGIAVLTTNYTVSSNDSGSGGGDIKPALGESWCLLADTRLTLEQVPMPPTAVSSRSRHAQPPDDKKHVRITLAKSPRKAIGESVMCELGAAGFRPLA